MARIPIRSRDANEPAIVDYLRYRRAAVYLVDPDIRDEASAGFPDLVVWHRGRLFMAEVKAPGGSLKPKQRAFAKEHSPVWVLRDIEDAQEMLDASSDFYLLEGKEGE